ncbi:SH3 domain-containing protein [Rubrimonas cliftonensis]|nr:SH3 domain-containing protein [Rubrimonas cliftonensis]
MRLTGRGDIWDGWRRLWDVAADRREGWVPGDLPASAETCGAAGDAGGRVATAARDYGAAELDCAPGDALAVLERRHGWALCRDARGAVGWIPLRRLDV